MEEPSDGEEEEAEQKEFGDEVNLSAEPTEEEDDLDKRHDFPKLNNSEPYSDHYARYMVKIYKAESLMKEDSSIMAQVRKTLSAENVLDLYVQVFFGGRKGSTSRKKSPYWNEQVVFTMKFPPPSEPMVIQVRHGGNKVIGTVSINMEKISDSGDKGFLPSFGPGYIFLREKFFKKSIEEDTSYKGRLLLAISTEILEVDRFTKPYVEVEFTTSLLEGSYGQETEFLLFGCIREASMIDANAGKGDFRFCLQFGDCGRDIDNDVSESEFATPYVSALPTNRHYLYIPYGPEKHCVWLKSIWPDNRRRMYISNILLKTAQKLEECLLFVGSLMESDNAVFSQNGTPLVSHLEDLEKTVMYYQKCLEDNVKDYLTKTESDNEKFQLYLKCLRKVIKAAKMAKDSSSKTMFDGTLYKLKQLSEKLKGLEDDLPPTLPDVIVWMECGNKRVGYSKISSSKLIYALNGVEQGSACGKIQCLFLKPHEEGRKTDKMLCKIEVCLWLGLSSHSEYCFTSLPQGFEHAFLSEEFGKIEYLPRTLTYFEGLVCQMKAYIFQARSLQHSDIVKFPSPSAKMFVGDSCLHTQTYENSLNPIWDEMLVFQDLVIHIGKESLQEFLMTVIVEINNCGMPGKSTFMGRCVTSVPVTSSKSARLPSLKWYDIDLVNSNNVAQLLAAFELKLLETPDDDADDEFDTVFDQTDRGPVLSIPDEIRPTFALHKIEVLFWGIRDLKRIHLKSIKKIRINVECAGQVIQSSVIVNYRKYSNFIDMLGSFDVYLPEEPSHFPGLTLKLLEVGNFGRETVIATHVVRSLEKYIFMPVESEKEPFRNTREQTVVNLEPLLPVSEGPVMRKVRFHRLWRESQGFQGEEEEEKDWWSRYYASSGEYPQPRKSSLLVGRASIADITDRRRSLRTGSVFGNLKNIPRYSLPTTSTFNGKLNRLSKFSLRQVEDTMMSPSSDADGFMIYTCELENVPEFGGFQDWLHSFPLTRGKKSSRIISVDKIIAVFKGCFRIYREPLPPHAVDKTIPFNSSRNGKFSIIPENKPMKVLIRAYIVKAVNLTPADKNNTCDAYVVMKVGKQKFNDKEHYVSKQLNPVFGKCFEFVANFPSDSMLQVQVFDWDLVGSDDFIGETTIDLENRFYSKHRATCGLPRSYETSGPNAWRDALTPTEILNSLCLENDMDGPYINSKEICIDNVIYDFGEDFKDEETSEEHMALCVLHKWQEVCPQKYPLVPEHVEVRTLYHPSKPGESQGQLYMWIDMFPEDTVAPSMPRDIAMRKPTGYELRVIVWNTDDVTLSDDAFFTGEKMSDIYVKGWLTGKSDEQTTDIHYRSLTGEGNFNWRFVFPFSYLAVERNIVVTKKVSLFSWDETEFKMPPVLNLEVWDADQFSKDDYLGELRLDLNNFPRGAKSSRLCNLKMLKTDGSVPHMSLFKQKRTKGWWPFFTRKNGKMELAGKVEAELHLLKAEEAEKTPVGKGRKGPEALEMPERPVTSFHNLLNPLKTLRYAFWRNYKWKILYTLFIIALALLIALFFYSVPGYSVKKLLGA